MTEPNDGERIDVILEAAMNKRNLFVLITFVLLSCGKDEEPQADSEPPVISLTSPTNGQVFSGGQSVTISGSVTDNVKLREVHLEIINTTSGAFVAHEHFYPDGASYSINRTFSVQAATGYKIKVEAEDSRKNITRAEVNVSSN